MAKITLNCTSSQLDTNPNNYIGPPKVDQKTGKIKCKDGKEPDEEGSCPVDADDHSPENEDDRLSREGVHNEGIREWMAFYDINNSDYDFRFGLSKEEAESEGVTAKNTTHIGMTKSDTYLDFVGQGLVEAMDTVKAILTESVKQLAESYKGKTIVIKFTENGTTRKGVVTEVDEDGWLHVSTGPNTSVTLKKSCRCESCFFDRSANQFEVTMDVAVPSAGGDPNIKRPLKENYDILKYELMDVGIKSQPHGTKPAKAESMRDFLQIQRSNPTIIKPILDFKEVCGLPGIAGMPTDTATAQPGEEYRKQNAEDDKKKKGELPKSALENKKSIIIW